MTDDLVFLPIRRLGDLIRTKQVSPVELATLFLTRLENYGHTYNAIVTITHERAMRQAKLAEDEIASGHYRGHLHGVPYGVKDLLATAQSLWMQCLVEVHDEAELATAVDAGAEIIGINNRDLHTFTTDLGVTERLAPLVPRGKVIVSESGISGRDDLRRLSRVRVDAVLVGEALVTATDIGAKVRELSGQQVQAG